MAIRTLAQVIADAITFIQSKIPTLSLLEGTVARDVVIESPAQEFNNVYIELQRTQTIQTLTDPTAFEENELDDRASDVGLARLPGTPATVAITFRLPIITVDITVTAGVQVSTSGENPVVFRTTTSGQFLVANASSYYNSLTGLYELSVIAEALNTGISGNVASGTINTLLSTIANASSMTIINELSATGGTDIESDESLALRIQTKLTGNNVGTINGVLSLIRESPTVVDSLIVRPGDSELLRNQYGNAYDIVIIGETVEDVVETHPFSTSQLEIHLNRQPVRAVTSVQGFVSGISTIFIEGVDYSVSIDNTSMYVGTTLALSKVIFSGLGSIPDDGSTVTITYSFNSLIELLQTQIESDDNKIIGADPLVKEATEVLINVGASIRTFPGYIHTDVANAAVTNVTTLLSEVKLDTEVDQSDIIVAIQSTPGVDEVDIPLTLEVKRPSDPGFISVTNVVVNRTEYGRPNTIIIV